MALLMSAESHQLWPDLRVTSQIPGLHRSRCLPLTIPFNDLVQHNVGSVAFDWTGISMIQGVARADSITKSRVVLHFTH
jgi:hypothetical protein